MGDTMKVTKGELAKLVSGLERYSAIEGDILQNAANVGLSFNALAGNPKLFKQTMKAAVDMSAALGMDVQASVTMLGKAMQNGAKGAAALGGMAGLLEPSVSTGETLFNVAAGAGAGAAGQKLGNVIADRMAARAAGKATQFAARLRSATRPSA
jgi:hypothetical protein